MAPPTLNSNPTRALECAANERTYPMSRIRQKSAYSPYFTAARFPKATAPPVMTLQQQIAAQRDAIRLIRQAQGAINGGDWDTGIERLTRAINYTKALRETADGE
jgi:hypothetical protein